MATWLHFLNTATSQEAGRTDGYDLRDAIVTPFKDYWKVEGFQPILFQRRVCCVVYFLLYGAATSTSTERSEHAAFKSRGGGDHRFTP